MKKTNFEKVVEFNRAMGRDGAKYDYELGLKLIVEEFEELLNELSSPSIDRTALAKELADLLYVCYSAADNWNIPIDKVFDRVHQANMSKLGPDGKPVYREDGKIMKGPNYQPPQLEFIFK